MGSKTTVGYMLSPDDEKEKDAVLKKKRNGNS
jgi:hypothetical protein